MSNHVAMGSYFLEWQMQINTKTYLIFIFINDSLSLKLIFLIFLTPETILQLLKFLIVSYFQMLSRVITRNLSIVQRSILAVGCGVQAVLDPYRYDCVAYSAEASTPPCQLTSLADRISRTDEGKRVLNEKPNIHSNDIDLDYLASLGELAPPLLVYLFIY